MKNPKLRQQFRIAKGIWIANCQTRIQMMLNQTDYQSIQLTFQIYEQKDTYSHNLHDKALYICFCNSGIFDEFPVGK